MRFIFPIYLLNLSFFVRKVSQKWNDIIKGMPKTAHFNGSHKLSEIVQVLYTFPETIRSISLRHCDGDMVVILRKILR